MMLIAYWLYRPRLLGVTRLVLDVSICIYVVQMLLHKELLFWLHRCYMQPCCPDVIEPCERHRCYHAYFGCKDVICKPLLPRCY